MANGLLDFFGKDYEDPRSQGLLQFGLGLMQQGGYQDRPVSLGQAFGAAGQQGMQAYQQAVAEKQKKEQLAAQKSMQDLQTTQIKAQLAKDEAAQASAQKMLEARKQLSDFNALVAGDPQFIPKGMDVQAEQMRLFAEAYPTEYARMMAEKFAPKEPVIMAAGSTAYDLASGKALFTAPAKPSASSLPASTKGAVVKMDVLDDQGNKIGTQPHKETLVLDPNSPDGYKKDQIGNPVYEYKSIGNVTNVGDPDPIYEQVENAAYIGETGLENKTVYKKKDEKGIVSYYVMDESGQEVSINESDFLDKEELKRQTLNFKDTSAEFQKLNEEVSGINAIDNFIAEINKAPKSGLEKGLASAAGKLKAILGKDLTEQEKAVQVMQALQQGMLGQVRVDVLGPGVLTENDAQRLIKYLGGDLGSITTNPEVVIDALTRISNEKQVRFDNNARIVNYNIKRIADVDDQGRRGGMSLFNLYKPDPINPYLPDYQTSVEDSGILKEAADFAASIVGLK